MGLPTPEKADVVVFDVALGIPELFPALLVRRSGMQGHTAYQRCLERHLGRPVRASVYENNP